MKRNKLMKKQKGTKGGGGKGDSLYKRKRTFLAKETSRLREREKHEIPLFKSNGTPNGSRVIDIIYRVWGFEYAIDDKPWK